MIRPRATHSLAPRALVRTLAWLRLCAIGGQSVAVFFCTWWMRLPLPLLSLLLCIGLLAVFATFAAWRLSQPWPIREWEIIAHIAVDTTVLGYLLYFTGGATNPFITLLLVPIALGAAALSIRSLLAVALLAGLTYLLLLNHYVPLAAPLHHDMTNGLTLHVAGMGVNFAITALLLGFFINRLARALRLQQREVQRVRERALRNEGILAIATQAAGAAHELNTPLSTMLTLLPELRREHGQDHVLEQDLTLLQDQVERCRDILREMVAYGKGQLSQQVEHLRVAEFVHACIERFQLLRPEADLSVNIDASLAATELRFSPGLRHALVNLLNNALDASALRQSTLIELYVRHHGDRLEFSVSDHGPGFAELQLGSLGNSLKETGLGLGLSLAEATAQRLNGELAARNTTDGAEVSLRFPLDRLR